MKQRKEMPPGYPLKNRDVNGVEVLPGSKVELFTIPAWLIHDLPKEDQQRLKSYEGKVLTVKEFDEYGYVWFVEDSFCLSPAEVRCL